MHEAGDGEALLVMVHLLVLIVLDILDSDGDV